MMCANLEIRGFSVTSLNLQTISPLCVRGFGSLKMNMLIKWLDLNTCAMELSLYLDWLKLKMLLYEIFRSWC
jgi:hypothetical protein